MDVDLINRLFHILLAFGLCLPQFGFASSWQPMETVSCYTPDGGLDPSRLGCEASGTELNKRLDQLTPEPSRCKTSIQDAIQCCINPDQETCQYVKFDYTPSANATGIEGSYNIQIESYVKGYNDTNRRAYLCNYHIEKLSKPNCDQYIDSQHELLAVTPEDEMSPELFDALNNNIRSATAAYKEICGENLRKVQRCLETQAQSYKIAAGKTLNCRSSAVTEAISPEIICFVDSLGLEQCQFTASEKPLYQDLVANPSGSPDQAHGFMSIQDPYDEGNRWSCSGTAFGDGSQALTAAHCVPEGGQAEMWVKGPNGRLQQVTATCAKNPSYQAVSSHHDSVICDLSSPAQVSTNYFVATSDPDIQSGCIPQDHYLRCNPSVFRSMDGKDVQMVSYPGSQKRNGKYRPIYTNGKLKYNPATGNFNSDVFGDGGSSGAGYITEIDGYPVIISNNSAKTIASSQRVAPVIEWKDIAKMRTRLSQQKVDGADHIFN